MEMRDSSAPEKAELIQQESQKFYKKYCDEYYKNVHLIQRLLTAVTDNKRIEDELKGISETLEDSNSKRKRRRRPANEISRHHKCPAIHCGKAYGSEGSLSQHVRLKHRSLYEEYSKGTLEKDQKMTKKEDLS
ncbi:unnamed protein product [Moneuplotes crassus]|uniref:C2H2-type domain-containing protein n=1 Tax=Euplotes crassus TaxID=5936 RepID=A0AAD1Y1A0_EUPCR|nr:unnamed protein product [Moneuplotes crassus]